MTLSNRWSTLSTQQLGRYAEYLVKMELTLHRLDVYTAEVDDKGIDFVIRKDSRTYYDIQVKASRNLAYVFFSKDKFELSENLYAALVLFFDDNPPELFLIPATAWREPNEFLVEHPYEGLKSKPEYGINLSKRNLHILQQFAFDKIVNQLKPDKDRA